MKDTIVLIEMLAETIESGRRFTVPRNHESLKGKKIDNLKELIIYNEDLLEFFPEYYNSKPIK